ncbi:hypothetical protein M0802_016415 [Mischocyttarus mexicanus]|nr:hypothetical protein M0802_016432 [Mischocyttarus mexicanus]KAI4472943.1 hypothetical protein M0802_016415 [Mischocyttarus mexicanus]
MPNKEVKVQIDIKKETSNEIANGNTVKPIHTDIPPMVIKTEPVDTTSTETTGNILELLEEQAAKEIIEDLNSTETKETSNVLTLHEQT